MSTMLTYTPLRDGPPRQVATGVTDRNGATHATVVAGVAGLAGVAAVANIEDRLAGMPMDALVRELIARAAAMAPDGAPMLDVTLDGVRCALHPVQPSLADTLSPREREIARMVALGYTNKMIASVLDISLWTVSTHLRRVFLKLEVSTRAAMVALVLDR